MAKITFSKKQIFVFKATLGTVLAINAGDYLAIRTDYGFYNTFAGDLNYWLFPLSCLVIMQWILSSEYLPKGWVFAGIIGCIAVIPVIWLLYFYIPSSVYQSHYFQMLLLNSFVKGFFSTISQGILMKNRNGFLWVVANAIGWILSDLYGNLNIHLLQPIPSFPIIQTLIYHTYYFPLGIMIGLSLYNVEQN